MLFRERGETGEYVCVGSHSTDHGSSEDLNVRDLTRTPCLSSQFNFHGYPVHPTLVVLLSTICVTGSTTPDLASPCVLDPQLRVPHLLRCTLGSLLVLVPTPPRELSFASSVHLLCLVFLTQNFLACVCRSCPTVGTRFAESTEQDD